MARHLFCRYCYKKFYVDDSEKDEIIEMGCCTNGECVRLMLRDITIPPRAKQERNNGTDETG